MKRRKLLILGAAALILVLSTGIGTAWAYFSTYSEAEGGYRLHLARQREVEIEEEFSQWTKRISLKNEEGKSPVYVRAKVFAPTMQSVSYLNESGKWSLGEDGYYYYNKILQPGDTTPADKLIGTVTMSEKEAAELGGSFTVTAVQECSTIIYDDNNVAQPMLGWTLPGGVARQ